MSEKPNIVGRVVKLEGDPRDYPPELLQRIAETEAERDAAIARAEEAETRAIQYRTDLDAAENRAWQVGGVWSACQARVKQAEAQLAEAREGGKLNHDRGEAAVALADRYREALELIRDTGDPTSAGFASAALEGKEPE